MKNFQLIHVCPELGARSCNLIVKELLMDPTVPPEEFEAALDLEVGEKMIIHYGGNPVKTGTLIRKEDTKGE